MLIPNSINDIMINMKIFSVIFLSLVLTVIASNEALAQDVYIKPYCAESGLSLEEHVAKEKAIKYNQTYAELIISNNTMEEKLDRSSNIRCELISTTSNIKREELLVEYDALKVEIKSGIQLLND